MICKKVASPYVKLFFVNATFQGVKSSLNCSSLKKYPGKLFVPIILLIILSFLNFNKIGGKFTRYYPGLS